MKIKFKLFFVLLFFVAGCTNQNKKTIPVVGFLDLMQDETLAEARKGFFVALKDKGFDVGKKNMEVVYRNAQNDQPTLLQACDYLISQNVDLIATNPTLPTLVAIQKTKDIPVFMMVSPRPDIAGLTKNGKAPANLFGVYETLDYIDTAVELIQKIIPSVKKIGTIFNQSEPQSMDALHEIEKVCAKFGWQLEKLPVNNSNETQLVVEALLAKNIDAFFALPDNTVFSSMEVIVKSCDHANVPVFTSEQGLVKRGAVVAFGADMFQWGYQCGIQAAQYLNSHSLENLKPEIVTVRKKVFNAEKAKQFHLTMPEGFEEVNN